MNALNGMMRLRNWIVLGLVVVAGIALWRWTAEKSAQASAMPQTAQPVDVATVARADVPVYLTGLGTVQAFNTVTATARVDGQLQKVAFTEGQEVKKGDLIAQIDPRPFQAQLDQALAKQAQDQAQLSNTQNDLQRYTALAAMDYTSKQTLDTTRSQVAQLAAQVKSDGAAIMNARTQLDYTTIRSPIDGRTGIRLVDVGNNVHATDTTGIVVITQLHPISVIFSLPEDDLPTVSRAMQAGMVQVVALPREGDDELDRGTVALIDNQIDQATGTIRLKATFPNTQSTLWPGAYVNVRLLLKTDRQVPTIPSAAVQRGPDGLYTYLLKPDSTVEMRTIKVAQDDGTRAVVTEGVTPGDRVVTQGQYRLKAGARVQIRTAPAPSANAPAASAPDAAPAL
jgi:multidrug efflux system membrane fusion protein